MTEFQAQDIFDSSVIRIVLKPFPRTNYVLWLLDFLVNNTWTIWEPHKTTITRKTYSQ